MLTTVRGEKGHHAGWVVRVCRAHARGGSGAPARADRATCPVVAAGTGALESRHAAALAQRVERQGGGALACSGSKLVGVSLWVEVLGGGARWRR